MSIFSTKAETPGNLWDFVSKSEILPLFRFNVSDWKRRQKTIIKQSLTLVSEEDTLIVRISALGEGTKENSQAGYIYQF